MYISDVILRITLAFISLLIPSILNDYLISDDLLKPGDIIKRLTDRTTSYPQEKIYLHTDKSIYGLGDHIWFKTYLVDAATHQQNTPSTLVHVELKDPNGKLVKSLNIKMESGWDRGDILIENTWTAGEYTLLAYTAYMCNYEHQFLFQRSLFIGDPFNQITTEKTKVENVVIDFYPEGGELVSGLSCTVGFTARDGSGKLIHVKGRVLDSDGKEIVALNTLTEGFGRFEFIPEKVKYKAIIQYEDEEYEINLPEVLKDGYVLSVNNRHADYHLVKVTASEKHSLDDVFILAHIRGIPVALIEDLDGESAIFKIEKQSIPEGVMHITLFDNDSKPWCERLVFNDHTNDKISTEVTIPYTHFVQRQEANIDIYMQDDNGNPIQGDLSVSITDSYIVPASEHEINIQNYLLLLSDLDRPLPDPGFYTATDTKSRYFLDMVLLTYGWRRFNWKDIIEENEPDLQYPPKSGFDIRGNITKDNNPLESNMTISLINEELELLESSSDKNGDFNLYEVAIWDTTDVIFQANDNKDKKIKKAEIELKEDLEFPINAVNIQPSSIATEEDLKLFLNATIENERLDSFFRTEFSIDLDEVTVTSTRSDINRRLREERSIPYGDVDNRIILDSLKYIQPYYSVFDIVKLSSPGVQVFGTPGVDQEFRFRGNNSLTLGNGATILINGVPASVGAANALRAADIEFVDVLRGLSKTALYGDLGRNGIVAIYTKSGRTPSRRRRKIEGLFNMQHPGYYRAREFSSPDYSTNLPLHKKPDFRTTLFWSPDVSLNEEGKAVISFYTADRNTTYRMDLQGMTADGRPIHKLYFFDVKEY